MITSNKIKRHEKRYIVLSNKIFNIPLKNLCNSTTNDITINKSKFNRQFITVASMTQGHIYYRLQGLQLTFIFLAKLFLSKLHFRGYLFLLALIPLFQIDSNPSSDSEFTLRGKQTIILQFKDSNALPNSHIDTDVERNESQYDFES